MNKLMMSLIRLKKISTKLYKSKLKEATRQSTPYGQGSDVSSKKETSKSFL